MLLLEKNGPNLAGNLAGTVPFVQEHFAKNRLEEVKRIGSLERRTDALENDVKHIKGGMDYLFKQVTSPETPPRRRIGFGADENDTPPKPYAKL